MINEEHYLSKSKPETLENHRAAHLKIQKNFEEYLDSVDKMEDVLSMKMAMARS